ncbi:MAG: right-handed parallel beta-helix repeat-containing protein [Thermoplasmatota archaeon]
MEARKKSIVILLNCFLVVVSVQATIAIASPYIEYSSILTVGYIDSDFSSIQEAVRYADEGATIYIKNGIYNEIITIDMPLTLIGENKEHTIIVPTSEQNSYAVHSRAPNVTIKELSISNKGPGMYTTGLKITGNKTLVESCIFYDNPIGIAIWSSNNTVVNSTFYGCNDEGIAILGTASNPLTHNHIKQCIFYENTDGIELQHASNTIIEYCEFFDNNHAGIDIIGSYNKKNKIINCLFTNNKVFGLYMIRSTQTLIDSCVFVDSPLMFRLSSDVYMQSSIFESLQLYDTTIEFFDYEPDDKKNIHAVNSVFNFAQEPLLNSRLEDVLRRNNTPRFQRITLLVQNILERINNFILVTRRI